MCVVPALVLALVPPAAVPFVLVAVCVCEWVGASRECRALPVWSDIVASCRWHCLPRVPGRVWAWVPAWAQESPWATVQHLSTVQSWQGTMSFPPIYCALAVFLGIVVVVSLLYGCAPCLLDVCVPARARSLHLRQLVWVDSAPDAANPSVTHVLLAGIHSGVDAPIEQLVGGCVVVLCAVCCELLLLLLLPLYTPA